MERLELHADGAGEFARSRRELAYLKLTFRGNRIQASYDGTLMIDVTDNDFDGVPAYTNGAVGAHMFMAAPFVATFENCW